MENKMLLVGSIFDNSPRNKNLYEIQTKFLEKTTENFEHVVIISQDTDYKLFNSKIIKVFPPKKYKKLKIHGQSKDFDLYLDGCNELLRYYRIHDKYNELLILDKDAFPISQKWQRKLELNMGNKQYAAPIKIETLDTYPHPSIFFLKDKYWQWNFTPDKWTVNLINERFLDIGSTVDLKWCYPLLRSNTYNPHPIYAGIYCDIFYHHGFSSVRGLNYWDVKNHEQKERDLFNELINDTEKFINSLAENPFRDRGEC